MAILLVLSLQGNCKNKTKLAQSGLDTAERCGLSSIESQLGPTLFLPVSAFPVFHRHQKPSSALHFKTTFTCAGSTMIKGATFTAQDFFFFLLYHSTLKNQQGITLEMLSLQISMQIRGPSSKWNRDRDRTATYSFYMSLKPRLLSPPVWTTAHRNRQQSRDNTHPCSPC